MIDLIEVIIHEFAYLILGIIFGIVISFIFIGITQLSYSFTKYIYNTIKGDS